MALLFLVILSLCWIISFSAKPTNPPTTFPSLFPTQLTSSPTAPSTAPTPLPSASPVTLGPTPPTIAGFPYDGWTEHLSPSFPRELAHNAIGINPSNNAIFLLGERTERTPYQLVEFDYTTDTITDHGAAILPEFVFGEGHFYAQVGTILYIGNQGSSFLHTFDVTTTEFKGNVLSPPLNCGFVYACLVNIRDEYLAILGNDGVVQILDTNLQDWLSDVPSSIVGRSRSSCAYLNNKMYNVGGFNLAQGGGQSSIEIVDASPTAINNMLSVSWNTNPQSMGFAIQDARSIAIGNQVLVVGGYDRDNGINTDTIYAIDGTSGSVTLVGHLSKLTIANALIVADNVLYCFGGKDLDVGWKQWQTKAIPTNTASPSKAAVTPSPSDVPSQQPTGAPIKSSTIHPSTNPSEQPTRIPSVHPSEIPTINPTATPSQQPTVAPVTSPTVNPSINPSEQPTRTPSKQPTVTPSQQPTRSPSTFPSMHPTQPPSLFSSCPTTL